MNDVKLGRTPALKASYIHMHIHIHIHVGRSATNTNGGITRQKVTVGGVPVVFNAPWQYGISSGIFSDAGLDVVWRDCQGGTAGMAQTLTEVSLRLFICVYV
jgi:ABC-type nitrate/sulfonate/bicarbonate transport system substrate-binding protein